MYFRTEGIILSQKNFAEADKLLTIYTKKYGKISCIAKTATRPLSKKAGHIELGNWCRIFVAKGKNIDLLTEAEIKKAFGVCDLSVEKANKIYHLLEVVNYLTPTYQKNLKIFDLLANFLNKTAQNKDFNLLSSIFKIKLLALLGYFSAKNLKESDTKKLLLKLEKGDLKNLSESVKLSKESYLKLLSFLDSMIENLTERKLKTKKFIDGN